MFPGVQPRNIVYPYDPELGEPTDSFVESERVQIGASLYPVLYPEPLPYDVRNFSVMLGNLGSGTLVSIVRSRMISEISYVAMREQSALGYLGTNFGPYTAPELILLTGCTSKVDVWALGCVVRTICSF